MARAKPIIEVEPDGPARVNIAAVLNSRLSEMCALRNQALNFEDPEGVHDMRVASRRLRSALKDFMPYLDARRLRSCIKEIRYIARALGRVRDHDVAILALQQLAAKAPEDVAFGITQFAESRKGMVEEAQLKLVAALSSQRLAELESSFQRVLKLEPAEKGIQREEITYRGVSAAIINERLSAFEGLAVSLYRPLKVTPLHELRLAAKNLRYALELFEPVWNGPSHPSLIGFSKKVAAMQGSLGKLHDCDIWIQDFGDVAARRIKVAGFDHHATTLWLLRHFVKLRGKHIGTALLQWQDWEKQDLSGKIRDVILLEAVANSSRTN